MVELWAALDDPDSTQVDLSEEAPVRASALALLPSDVRRIAGEIGLGAMLLMFMAEPPEDAGREDILTPGPYPVLSVNQTVSKPTAQPAPRGSEP